MISKRVHLHLRSLSWQYMENKAKNERKKEKREIQFRASREKNDKICFENSSLLSIP